MEPERQPDSMPSSAPVDSVHAGHKKAVLQKLMSNLLGKPGRSFHELSNGIKQAIGTYKNYSKEWDELNGVTPGSIGSTGASGAAGPSGIQKIIQGIQEKKNAPVVVPPTPQPAPPQVPPTQMGNAPANGLPPMHQMPQMPEISGPAQQSSFNRPAPVSSLGIHGY